MTKDKKSIEIEDLKLVLSDNEIVYIADISGLNALNTSNLRRACFKAGVSMKVVKNTLLKKSMDDSEKEYGDLPSVLKGSSAVMTAKVANAPGKIIKEFRKKSDKPILKGAYINSDIYIGDDQLNNLASIKSKEEVIGEIIGLLQSPAKRVISALLNQFDENTVSE